MTETVEKTEAQKDTDKIEDAVTWVVGRCPDFICVFCGWRPAYSDKKTPDAALRSHLRSYHPYLTIEAHLRQSIDPTNANESIESVIRDGFEVTDSFEDASPLYIPHDIKAQATKDGYTLRWANQANVQRYKDMGMEVVKAKAQPEEGSTEDSTVRSMDVVLMRIPPRLKAVLDRRRAAKSNDAVFTRKEDFERKMEAHARAIHDRAIIAGASKDQAMNLARAAERGLAFGSVDVRRG